jgi:hypothetical protein
MEIAHRCQRLFWPVPGGSEGELSSCRFKFGGTSVKPYSLVENGKGKRRSALILGVYSLSARVRLQVHKVHSDALVGFCVKNVGSLSGDFEKPDTRNPLTTHGLGPKCRVCRVSGTGESPQESSAAGLLREASPVLDSKWTPGRSYWWGVRL